MLVIEFNGIVTKTKKFECVSSAFEWARRQYDQEIGAIGRFAKKYEPIRIKNLLNGNSRDMVDWECLICELAYADASDGDFYSIEELDKRNQFYEGLI